MLKECRRYSKCENISCSNLISCLQYQNSGPCEGVNAPYKLKTDLAHGGGWWTVALPSFEVVE